jgi:hypothetical protein
MGVEIVMGTARQLGILVTRAPRDSELFECWADRVAMARVYERHGEHEQLARAIDEANRYAQSGGRAPAQRASRRLAQPSRSIRSLRKNP